MDDGTWDNLKSACSNCSPAGENCEYEPAFLDLMNLATPRAEVQMGATIIAARLPDWPTILQQSLSLSQRTRDLRVGVILTESLAQIHSWNGLAEGLEILWCWTTQLWHDVLPELDRDEHNDPTARLSALAHMLGDQFLLRTLHQLPLAEHASLGTLRLRDTIAICKGKKEVARELSVAEIETFFDQTEALDLAMRLREVDRCCAAVEAIDEFLNNQPGTDGWSAARLLELLNRSRDLLFKHLSDQQFVARPATANLNSADTERHPSDTSTLPESTFTIHKRIAQTPANEQDYPFNSEGADEICPSAMVATVPPCPLQIKSRNEATVAIDAVSEYFQIHEPASPVPLLLQRAKRLISMNFVELMHELAPNEAMQLLRQLHVVDKAG